MNQLTEEVRSKLQAAGFKSVADFVACTPGKLVTKTGIPFQEVVELRRKLLHQFTCIPVPASTLWEANTHAILPTGSHNLDQLLDGGLPTGELTEVCGGPGTGKTQLCHSIGSCISMTTNSTVAYIDPTGSFDPQLMRDNIVSRYESEEEFKLVIAKIRVFQIFSIFDLLTLLVSFKNHISKMDNSFFSNLHLIIIDPVTLLLSPLLGGRHSHGHILMSQLVGVLRELAVDHGIAILYTNNMVVDIESHGLKPALGLTWSHTPSTRLRLSTTAAAEDTSTVTRIATVTKSQRQAVGVSTTFKITSSGLK